MRARSIITAATMALALAIGFAASSDALAAQPRTCGFIRGSVPYSRHGNHDRWRVYVKGAATCNTAKRVLSAVLHLKATPHVGPNDATSYFTYRAWTCGFGNMGGQGCWLPAHPPYRAVAVALDCTIAGIGCPRRVPSDLL